MKNAQEERQQNKAKAQNQQKAHPRCEK
jgi:hypothetical protein